MRKNRNPTTSSADAAYARLMQAAQEAADGTPTTAPTAVIDAADRQLHRLLRKGSADERAGLLKLLKGVGARGERVAEQALGQAGLSDEASLELLTFLADRTAAGHPLPTSYRTLGEALASGAQEIANATFTSLPVPLAGTWARRQGTSLLAAGDASITSLMEANEAAAAALLDTLGGTTATPVLERLARLAGESASRSLRKAIRARFYRLAQAGVEVPAIAETAEVTGGLRLGPTILRSEAFMSAVDSSGDQAIWILEEQTEGGHSLLQAIVDQTGSLGSASAMVVVRRGRDHVLERLNEDSSLPVAPLPVEEAMGILEEAYAANPAVAGKEYRGWRQLARADRRARRPQRPPPDPAASPLARRSGELFDSPVCRPWLLTRAEAERAERVLAEGAESTLVLPDHETARRRNEAGDRARDAVFTSSARARLADRLERSARYLAHRAALPQSPPTDGELARMARATAEALRQGETDVPFLDRMLEASLEALRETVAAEAKPPDGAPVR